MSHSFISHSAEQTRASGIWLGQRVGLRPEWGKIILLSGNLGAGKTIFAQGFFAGLGITESVHSPTFSYFHQYTSDHGTVLHGDLYRMQDAPKSAATLQNQLQEYTETGHICLLEWADLLFSDQQSCVSENYIRIHIERGKDEQERLFTVDFHNAGNISQSAIQKLMDEFKTPVHVRKHIAVVTGVAEFVAQQLLKKGVLLDLRLVKNGAIAHDLVRYVDFQHFDDISQYQEEVTAEKISFWKQIQQQYRTIHHSDAIADILEQRGFFATAAVAAAHNTGTIFRKKRFTWEERLVYYADKRALHDTLVSLQERLIDGQKRYGHEASLELNQRIFALEAEIFAPLDIQPKDVTKQAITSFGETF